MVDSSVTIFGNLTRDPDLTVKDGIHRCNFRLASTERKWDRTANQYVDGHSVFISVTCWRVLAQHVAGSVGKGDPVVVVGRLRQRSYVNSEGATVNLTEIEGEVVAVDLRRGLTTRLHKVAREAGADHSFDTSSPEGMGVVAADGTSGFDGGEAIGHEADLAVVGASGELAGAAPELVGAAGEPPF